jgi:cell division FtsZ-interacting protein ZapD
VCDLEIKEQQEIKKKLIKELNRNTKKVPDEYNGEEI